MKTLVRARLSIVCAIVAVASPVLSAHAQQATQSSGVTRAQVEKELANLESVGYDPTADDDHYPNNLQAAEERLASRHTAPRPRPHDLSTGD